MVGLGGLEPPTFALSGQRSNQLSYRPRSNKQRFKRESGCTQSPSLWSSPKRKKPQLF
jgi:hypothetical protein